MFPLPSGVAGVTRHRGLFPHRHQATYQTRLKTRRNEGFSDIANPLKKRFGQRTPRRNSKYSNVRLPESP